MVRRIGNFALAFFAVFFLAVFVVAAAFWWRLSKGPVSLAFLKNTVEQQINTSLPELDVSIKNVVIERDEKTGQPRLRLQKIQFKNLQGRLIAQAPRAAIAIRGTALLAGSIEPTGLELIGARLFIQRRVDGTIGLGFGASKAFADFENNVAHLPTAKPQGTDIFEGVELLTTQTANLLDYLDGAGVNKNSAASGLEKLSSVRITKTAITLYDESNGAVWFSPDASLVFRRAPYGFAMFVDGNIAGRSQPWRLELTAHYRNATQKFKVSSRVFDVIPAELARDVFALSELAQVQLPLSGHVEAEFTRDGKMTRASAEFSAAAGKVGFPGYISEPIIIDEGLVRLDFDPETGDIVIGNSAIFVGGSQAQLAGRIRPVRNDKGRLSALGIILNASNVAIDAAGTVKNPAMFNSVKFDGLASIEKARLVVNDLTLMSGSAGIRVRGQFVGGEKAAGVFLTGTIRDLPASTIKKMWPPVVARGAREWITENVVSGRMSQGVFKVAIPAETIVAARQDIPIPDEMVDFKFTLKDITSRYFGELPALTRTSGTGFLSGNHFVLNVKGGSVRLPGNKAIKLSSAVMKSKDLARPVTPSTITLNMSATAKEVLTLIDHKPLNLLDGSGVEIKQISGNASVKIDMDLPLSRKMKEDEVKVRATAHWKNGGFKGAVDGIDIAKGNFRVSVMDSKVVAKGKAVVNGLPTQVEWSRSIVANKLTQANLVLKTTMTEKKRAELGLDLSRFIRGRVDVKVTAKTSAGSITSAQINADLSKAVLVLDEIDWVHPAGQKTRASFNFATAKNVNQITNLKVSGGKMKITGAMTLQKDGTLAKAVFPQFRLDRTNDMSLRAEKKGNEIRINIKGKSFDARKLINQAFASRTARAGSGARAGSDNGRGDKQSAIRLKMNVANVLTNRGEQIKNVRGEVFAIAGQVARADIRGQFVGGAPVSLQIAANANRGRNLRFASRDAGAALRATNLYSKISGGTLSLRANLAAAPKTGIEKGLLVLRHFVVRNETALNSIKSSARKKAKLGPRRSGQKFSKLKLPFSTDQNFVNIGDALIKGSDLGASANGRIRKKDGAMDVGGTIIPAYALNSAVSGVPLLGTLLTGGKGQGVFGLTYALQGTMDRPKFIVNPVSALAPGFLRNLFAIGGGGNVGSDGTGTKKARKLKDDSER